jgi:hypothetical protein
VWLREPACACVHLGWRELGIWLQVTSPVACKYVLSPLSAPRITARHRGTNDVPLLKLALSACMRLQGLYSCSSVDDHAPSTGWLASVVTAAHVHSYRCTTRACGTRISSRHHFMSVALRSFTSFRVRVPSTEQTVAGLILEFCW